MDKSSFSDANIEKANNDLLPRRERDQYPISVFVLKYIKHILITFFILLVIICVLICLYISGFGFFGVNNRHFGVNLNNTNRQSEMIQKVLTDNQKKGGESTQAHETWNNQINQQKIDNKKHKNDDHNNFEKPTHINFKIDAQTVNQDRNNLQTNQKPQALNSELKRKLGAKETTKINEIDVYHLNQVRNSLQTNPKPPAMNHELNRKMGAKETTTINEIDISHSDQVSNVQPSNKPKGEMETSGTTKMNPIIAPNGAGSLFFNILDQNKQEIQNKERNTGLNIEKKEVQKEKNNKPIETEGKYTEKEASDYVECEFDLFGDDTEEISII